MTEHPSENPFDDLADLFADEPVRQESAPLSFVEGEIVFFDIETGPESEERLRELFQFDLASVKGIELADAEFDPESVKYGRMKDETKRTEKLAEAKQKFEQEKAAAQKKRDEAEAEAWQGFVKGAALSPVTGRVLAVGVQSAKNSAKNSDIFYSDPRKEGIKEGAVLDTFWGFYRLCRDNDCRLVGFNIRAFDLPFLVRRSWKLGIEVPRDVFDGRYWSRAFVDLIDVWRLGNYREYIKLDEVARFLGTARKSGQGADFHKLFFGTEEEHKQALDYLRQDLRVTQEVAERMGVI